MSVFPKLKHLVLSVNRIQQTIDVSFDKQNLIVGLIIPEISSEVTRVFEVANLTPYEQCVNKFTGSDFLYNMSAVNPAGTRTINNVKYVTSYGLADTDTLLTIIVAYLEFTI